MAMIHKIILALIVLFATSAPSWADGKRIVVLSDIHLMAESTKGSDYWNSTLADTRKIVEYSQQLFSQITDTLKAIKPDLLLISGDLTERGHRASHEYVRSKLRELQSAGIDVCVVPGNHDLNGNVDFGLWYGDFGYNRAIAREELSYAAEPLEGLTVIGLNSGTDGHLTEATIAFAENQAKAATEKGNSVLCMMHHALIPHIYNANAIVPSSYIANWESVKDRFAAAGIRVVLTGHLHVSDIAKDFAADSRQSIYDVSTGSIVSYPCDYRVLTLSDGGDSLTIETHSIKQLTGVDNFPDWARNELKSRMVRLLLNKAKLNRQQNASIYDFAAEALDTLAGLFAVHAEGNEVMTTKRQSLVNDLSEAAASAIPMLRMLFPGKDLSEFERFADHKLITSMLVSILTDQSPYGFEGRTNITDDRTLTIPLR